MAILHKIRFFVAESIGYMLIFSGIARLFLRRRHARGEITAIYFHNPQRDMFEKLMTKARSWGFEFIDAKELLNQLNGSAPSTKPLLFVSVDDGWRDNIANVASFAEQNNIPVCYFISTEPMESGKFWWTGVAKADVKRLKHVSNAERQRFLNAQYRSTDTMGRDSVSRNALASEEIKSLSQMSHATIGNHTHNHPILPQCTDQELEFELGEAHHRLSTLTKKTVEFFAYPSGEFDGREQHILVRMGYSMAFSTESRGMRTDAPDAENLFRLPRFSDNHTGGFAENFCRLIGLWQTLYRLIGWEADTHHVKSEQAKTNLPASTSIEIMQLVPDPLPAFRADVVALFGKYLPRHKINCSLVGRSGSSKRKVQKEFNKVHYAPYFNNKLLRELAFLWTCLRSLFSANKSHCDVIQVRDMASIGLLALCIARLKGIPFIYWMSFLMCEERIERARILLAKRRSLRNYLILLKGIVESFLLYRFILPNVQHVFVQSDAMANYVQAKGIKAEKMTAVPMGVDMEQFVISDLQCARPESWGTVPVVAYLGVLIESRDTKSLIDAFCLVRHQFPTARLMLVGGSDTPTGNAELLAYASRKGLPLGTVEITGWLPTQDAWKLLLNADVAVSYVPRSTIYDVSSPTKLMEYLAAGMPCVANDSPDQRHVLTQSNAGWLVNSNVDAIAEALIEILNDPISARKRSAAGPTYVEANRSYRVLAKMVAEQYQRIVPGHN